jgi:hypothetical protein
MALLIHKKIKETSTVMGPLPEHEKSKEIISDLVKIFLKKVGKRYEPFGSTTVVSLLSICFRIVNTLSPILALHFQKSM